MAEQKYTAEEIEGIKNRILESWGLILSIWD